MDENTARLILSSLCERATGTSGSVVLTSAELVAIQKLYGAGHSDTKGLLQTTLEPVVTNAPELHSFLPSVIWHPKSTPDQKILLCLDFGTSYSKAFVCDGDDSGEVPKCSIPDDHIDPRRSAFFMARSILRDIRSGVRAC